MHDECVLHSQTDIYISAALHPAQPVYAAMPTSGTRFVSTSHETEDAPQPE